MAKQLDWVGGLTGLFGLASILYFNYTDAGKDRREQINTYIWGLVDWQSAREREKAKEELAALQVKNAERQRVERQKELQANYRKELDAIPRPCVRRRSGAEDVTACDVIGIRLYEAYDSVKAKLERSGFFHRIGEKHDYNRYLEAEAPEFNLKVHFVEARPGDGSSLSAFNISMSPRLNDSRRAPATKRVHDDFWKEINVKFGAGRKMENGALVWGAEKDGARLMVSQQGGIGLSDWRFREEAIKSASEKARREMPTVKPPL